MGERPEDASRPGTQGLERGTRRHLGGILSGELLQRADVATQGTGLPLDDLLRIGLHRVLAEFEASGRIAVGRPTATDYRLAQIDTALGLAPSESIAEAFLDGIVADIRRGEVGMILEGWDFDLGPEWARAQIISVAAGWEGGAE